MSSRSNIPQILEYTAGDEAVLDLEWEGLVSTGFVFELVIQRNDGIRLVKTATLVDDGSTSGDTQAQWSFSDTDLIAGDYPAQVKVTNATSDTTTLNANLEFRVASAL